jgi:hypothetical protein
MSVTSNRSGPGRVRFNRQQELFLRQVRDQILTLQELTLRQRLDDATVSRWLRSPKFKKALGAALKVNEQRRILELKLAAGPAARKLTDLSRGDNVSLSANAHVTRLACISVMSMLHQHETHQVELGTKKDKREGAKPAVIPDCYPDVPREEVGEQRE